MMRALRRIVAVVAVLLVTASCSLDTSKLYFGDDSQYLPLIERGSREDAENRLNKMAKEMQDALVAEFGGEWSVPSLGRYAGTTGEEYEGYLAFGVDSPLWVLSVSVVKSRADKERAIKIVSDIGERYGFCPAHVIYEQEEPEPDFEMVADTKEGDKYSFGSTKLTSLDYSAAGRLSYGELYDIKASKS